MRKSTIQDLDLSKVFKYEKTRYSILAVAMRGKFKTMLEF